MRDKKRYTVQIDMYIYADNDYMARKKAHEYAEEIDSKHVNARANVIEIGEQPFASLGYRKLDDKSRPVDKEKDEPLPF
jgi:hypothetical protein